MACNKAPTKKELRKWRRLSRKGDKIEAKYWVAMNSTVEKFLK